MQYSNSRLDIFIANSPYSKINFAIDSIIKRIEEAKMGVPAETRQATPNGETVYLRPRPGASRMYPETDIPPISVTGEMIQHAQKSVIYPNPARLV